MKKINLAIVGYGNIGRAAIRAALDTEDMVIKAIVRRQTTPIPEGIPVIEDCASLKGIDAAILCLPSRLVPAEAEVLLQRGICTADSYDEHQNITEVRARLRKAAKEGKAASICAAGWDPGVDSMVRFLMEMMAPKGFTYTNFGPGLSMGHSAAVRAIPGVEDAMSLTIPLGTGLHRRMVYVQLNADGQQDAVREAIQNDPYFAHDETHVQFVDNVAAMRDMGHGVSMTRRGVSAQADNQNFEWRMSVNNPALTGQILVGAARAALRQKPGCYTMPEVAPLDFLPGKRDMWIAKLV